MLIYRCLYWRYPQIRNIIIFLIFIMNLKTVDIFSENFNLPITSQKHSWRIIFRKLLITKIYKNMYNLQSRNLQIRIEMTLFKPIWIKNIKIFIIVSNYAIITIFNEWRCSIFLKFETSILLKSLSNLPSSWIKQNWIIYLYFKISYQVRWSSIHATLMRMTFVKRDLNKF